MAQMEVDTDVAVAVTAVSFDKTTRREIRGVKRRGSEDPVFMISKEPLAEAQLNVSPSPGKTFLLKKPATDMALILNRLKALEEKTSTLDAELEAGKKTVLKLDAEGKLQKKEFEAEKKTVIKLGSELKIQKKTIKDLQDEVKNLNSVNQSQAEAVGKMQLRIELMDMENFELYGQRIGASRKVVAYGILEYVHNNVLTPHVRKVLTEKAASLQAQTKNQYMRFLNRDVFHGSWQQGSYEDVYLAWSKRETKMLSNVEVDWLHELLEEAEQTLITMALQSNILATSTTDKLRLALGSALSLERHKRNEACHYLSMGEKDVCIDVVNDLMAVMDKGQLNECYEIVEVMKFGCQLYKSSILSE